MVIYDDIIYIFKKSSIILLEGETRKIYRLSKNVT